jgi:hypothetical protein
VSQPPPRLWLPHLLREMADAHGLETALAFARRFGGRYLYLPAQATPEHRVAQAVGIDVLAWLIEHNDRLARIVVPRGPNDDRAQRLAAVGEMTAKGASADAIAEALSMHVRDVHRARGRLRAEEDAKQGRLAI